MVLRLGQSLFAVVGLLAVVAATGLADRRVGAPRTRGVAGIVVGAALSLYALWNVTGFLVLVAGVLVVYVGLPRLVGRYPLSDRGALFVAVPLGAVPALVVLLVDAQPFVHDAVAGVVLSGPAGYVLLEAGRRRTLTFLGTLVVLPVLSLFVLWMWITPPCTSCAVLGIAVSDHLPFWSALVASDGAALVRAWDAMDLPVVRFLSVTATGIGTLVFVYVAASMVGHILYSSQKGVEKVEDLTVVLVTIASEDVRETLYEAIEHNRTLLSEYEFRVLIDEGAELQPELEDMDVDLVVVPDSFESDAVAKGRAMQYFVEQHVTEDRWYAFLDDDNLVQGREFLYEIPAQETDGRLVMNSILVPRPGGSTIAFAIDHMRTLFDFTFFRTCTGLLGRPYAGLHGELLCARGDVLTTVGFDRASIVEDFAFADELVRRGIRTWQSQTVTSILSPRTLDGYFTQRARWFTGKAAWLPRCSPGTMVVTGLIQGVWLLGIFGGWAVGALWFLFGTRVQLVYLAPAVFSSLAYASIYVIGVARLGVRHLPKALLVPIYATVEHVAPYVAMLKRPDEFEVIEK